MASFEELLLRDGSFVYKTRGVSMEPMLRQDRDLVVIEKADGVLKKYDVALYKRGGDYVLHRVIKVKDGYYIIRGDNTYANEKVKYSRVIGVLSGFDRKGKEYSASNGAYRAYSRFWVFIYPIRYLFAFALHIARGAAKKLGIKRKRG